MKEGFPIDKWLRPLSWAVEWVDVAEDIVLRRGEPWFNISFDSLPLEALVKLQREDVTEEDRKRLLETKDVTAYINGTKSLWRKNAIQSYLTSLLMVMERLSYLEILGR